MPTVEILTEAGCILGEGPHWDVSSQSLYFVDIYGQKILKYTPSTKKLTKAAVDKPPSFIIPIKGKNNEFIVSLGNEVVVISWDGESENYEIVQKLCEVETSKETPRTFNDARCDSTGRLWAGANSLAEDFFKTLPVGALYSFEAPNKLKTHVDQVRCSNGMAFNDKTKKMFYIDSLEGRIDQFDFDITNGTISNREPWFTLKNFDITGGPDGMTIDSDGNLWVAVFGGGRVLKVDGSKCETLIDTINIPVPQVTSATFGGSNLDELYVTTACIPYGNEPNVSATGATYKVTGTGAKGLPAATFKLN